jgi:hypothetical protein
MKNILEFEVRELIVINNLIQHPSVQHKTKIKDLSLIDTVAKKVQSRIGQVPAPTEALSDNEADKEKNEQLVKQYEEVVDNWLKTVKDVTLSDTEVATIKAKINAFEGLSADPTDREILLSISKKLRINE